MKFRNKILCDRIIRLEKKAAKQKGKRFARTVNKAFELFDKYRDVGTHRFMPDNYRMAVRSLFKLDDMLRVSSYRESCSRLEVFRRKTMCEFIAAELHAEGTIGYLRRYERRDYLPDCL